MWIETEKRMLFLCKGLNRGYKKSITINLFLCAFLFISLMISGKAFSENTDYVFYAFNKTQFSDEKKTGEENYKFLSSLLFSRDKKQKTDNKIPAKIAEKYLLPKKGTQLYLFVNSEYKGLTVPTNYGFDDLPTGTGKIFSFEVDVKQIRCSDRQWTDYYQNGVLVSRKDGKGIKYFKSPQFFNSRQRRQPFLSLNETYEIVKNAAPEIDKISKHSCLNDYNVSSTLYIPGENAKIIFLKSKEEIYQDSTYVIINLANKNVIIRNKCFNQIININNVSFLVLDEVYEGGIGRTIYQVKKDQLIENSRSDMVID
jgi:hypothetical protein